MTRSEENKVKITSPSNGDDVGRQVIVEGTSDITDGESHIWILVHPKLFVDQWWPQDKPIVDANGNWQVLIYIGQPQDVGIDFEIAVAAFSRSGESPILTYHDSGRRTGQWSPIPFPKGTTSEVHIITVRKMHH